MVSRALIGQRLHQTASSWRQICQLLNTSIPFPDSDEIDFTPYPLSALLTVSRRLELPLTTLVPELTAITQGHPSSATSLDTAGSRAVAGGNTKNRTETGTSAAETAATETATEMAEFDRTDFGTTDFDAGAAGATPTRTEGDVGAWDSCSPDQRGMRVLTALAHAACPLDATDIAQALNVPLAEVSATLDHLVRHPHLTGPLTLRPVPPDLHELRPRVDLLDEDQLLMLKSMNIARDGMTAHEATVLRAALDLKYCFGSGSITGYLTEHFDTAYKLMSLGYLQPPGLTDAYIIDPDVINSQRSPHPEGGQYARLRSPQRSEPGYDEFREPDENSFPLRSAGFEPVSRSTPQHGTGTGPDAGGGADTTGHSSEGRPSGEGPNAPQDAPP